VRHLVIAAAAATLAAGVMVAFPSASVAQIPPMGGGYTNVIAIPVDDPQVKAIAGALFKPEGAGLFPIVIYMSGCAGIDIPPERTMQKALIDHLLSEGIATLIVDPFTVRHENDGVCDRLGSAPEIFVRGAKDVASVRKVVAGMPDVDQKHVFLQGYSYGAIASLMASDAKNPASGTLGVAGVIAYYPYCSPGTERTVPTLVLVGDKDDRTPASLCEAIKDQPNLDVVVLPGATHGFAMCIDQRVDLQDPHIASNKQAARDAQARVDAFISAHMGGVATQ
jgi:dienelactone hydrolase